jgi:hypothetical protein
VPSGLYGIFFEEINHAGDGGLYAELVRNRGFEDANLPPACIRDGNFITPPRTPHFDTGRPNDWRLRWDVENPHPSWSLEGRPPGPTPRLSSAPRFRSTTRTPHSLAVSVTRLAAGSGRVAVVNDGYWGIGVTSGAEFVLSFHARADASYTGAVTASLETPTGTVLARREFAQAAGRGSANGWRRFEGSLRATASAPNARLVLTFGSTGRLWLDMVSLFPQVTFKGRPNGLRPDLAQLIADMKPGFIRAPGGCFAEGITIESRPQWKRSLGPIETRPGTYSPWGYWSTDGFGYHEYLQFAEDIGADALWVANVGVSCSFRSGTFLGDEEVPALIQDALDAIEYAIGPVTSRWGAERAKHGHPAPFPLKYVEVGNEQQGARYGERVARFYKAIKAKYPQIKIALSSWISGLDRRAIDAVGTIDIIDEHAYKPLNWAIENFDSFASYKREGWGPLHRRVRDECRRRPRKLGGCHQRCRLHDERREEHRPREDGELRSAARERESPRLGSEHDSLRRQSRVRARDLLRAETVRREPAVGESEDDRQLHGGLAENDRRTGWRRDVETPQRRFKDVRVERDGRAIYQSDFTAAARGWAPRDRPGPGCPWDVDGGAGRVPPVVECCGDFRFWMARVGEDVTISLRARKISGAEGFLVFGGQVDGRRVQWNVAGWGQHAVGDPGGGRDRRAARARRHRERGGGTTAPRGARAHRSRLPDGQLLNEATYPRIDHGTDRGRTRRSKRRGGHQGAQYRR